MKFTIGTVSSNINFEEDLRLIKSSLLYADDVELIGMAEYALFKYLPKCIAEANGVDELITCFVPILKSFDDAKMIDSAKQLTDFSNMLSPYKKLLKKKKKRSTQEIIAQKKLVQGENELRGLLENVLEEISNSQESKEIKDIIDKKVITVFDYGFTGFDTEELTGGFFANLLGTMKHGASYPLFDEICAEVVGAVINDKVLDICNINKEVLRHAGLATEILMTLPTLDGAKVDEILDFKKSMRIPLESFRKAIYSFSEKIDSLPWDENIYV